MQTFTSLSLLAILALNGIFVDANPVPATDSVSEVSKRNPLVISRVINCKDFDTPESCDTFCAAVWCFGLTDTLTREPDSKHKSQNRKDSGQSLFPFQPKNDPKYHLNRRTPQCQTADEYPFASSIEGGVGYGTQPRAIIQGTTLADSDNQAELANKVWNYQGVKVPPGGKVKIELGNYDKNKSPFCHAMATGDKTICRDTTKTKYFYQREDTNKGPNGAASFQNPKVV